MRNTALSTKDETFYRNNEQTITSLEVAEMVGKEHNDLMKDIRRYLSQMAQGNIPQSDFFVESTYKSKRGKQYPCYRVTKKGCEFIANKLTGTKGAVFTARFINRFHDMEDYIKREDDNIIVQCVSIVKFIADDLRVSDASRLFMYETYCKDVGIPTGFLPKYEDNGSREQCSATTLLERNGCSIKTVKFNQLLISAGYMELRERPSSKGGTKEYKALTDKGLKYGVNLISNKNQKEVQPYYYADTFMELYNMVTT